MRTLKSQSIIHLQIDQENALFVKQEYFQFISLINFFLFLWHALNSVSVTYKYIENLILYKYIYILSSKVRLFRCITTL